MLLNEVAIGKPYEIENYQFVDKLPEDCHSTLARGQNIPDPELYTEMIDKTIMPSGKIIRRPADVNKQYQFGFLGYNEYVVYNLDQVKMRYLIQVIGVLMIILVER